MPSIIVRALPFDVAFFFFFDALTTLNIYFFSFQNSVVQLPPQSEKATSLVFRTLWPGVRVPNHS